MRFIFAVLVLVSALQEQRATADRAESIVRHHKQKGERSGSETTDFASALSNVVQFMSAEATLKDVKAAYLSKATELFNELHKAARSETVESLQAQAAQAEDVFIFLLDFYVYKSMYRARIPALVQILIKSEAWKSASKVQRVEKKVLEMAAALEVTTETIQQPKNQKVKRFMDDFGVELQVEAVDIKEPEEVVVDSGEASEPEVVVDIEPEPPAIVGEVDEQAIVEDEPQPLPTITLADALVAVTADENQFKARNGFDKSQTAFSDLRLLLRRSKPPVTAEDLNQHVDKAEDVLKFLTDIYIKRPVKTRQVMEVIQQLFASELWMQSASGIPAYFEDAAGPEFSQASREKFLAAFANPPPAPALPEEDDAMPEVGDPIADPVLDHEAGPGRVEEIPEEVDNDVAAESLPPGWVPTTSSGGEPRYANKLLRLQVRSAAIAWMAHDGDLDELTKLPYGPPDWVQMTKDGKTWLHNKKLKKSVWTKRDAWEYALPPPGWIIQESTSNPGTFKFTYAAAGLSFPAGPLAWLWQNGRLDKLAQIMLPTGWQKVESKSNGHKYYNKQRQQQMAEPFVVYHAIETWQVFAAPPGWMKVPSRSNPGKFCYQNDASKKRVWTKQEAWKVYSAVAAKL